MSTLDEYQVFEATLDGKRSFRRGLGPSLAIHAVLSLFLFAQGWWWRNHERTPYSPTLRVDIVGLPDIVKGDLPNKVEDVTKEPEIKAPEKSPDKSEDKIEKKTVPPPDAMTLKKVRKKDLKSALERIKALDKVRDQSEDRPQAPPIKGNILSAGTDTSADAKENGAGPYYDGILESVRGHWSLPAYLARGDLSAQIEILVDSQGHVRAKRMLKSSGNSSFDEAALRAIEESEPFPPPPENIRKQVLEGGIVLGFPL